MSSSYTPNKNLEKPGNGDYVDTWNIPVNSDMNYIDSALGGVTNLNATAGNATLSNSTLVTANYINLVLNITGAISSNVTYTIPAGVGGQWIVRNATTGNSIYTVTIASGGGGSNVTVVRDRSVTIWSDGTDIRDVNENLPSIGTVTSVNVVGGTTGLTTTGGPITTTGNITLGGVLVVANGGTGSNTSTGNGSVVLQDAPTITGNAVLSGSNVAFTANTAVRLPVGTTANRPNGVSGMIRFNSNLTAFEGYNGSGWGSVGGATGGGSDRMFYLNGQVVTTSYTIPTGQNAMTTGPVTLNSGVTVTVSPGSRYVVL